MTRDSGRESHSHVLRFYFGYLTPILAAATIYIAGLQKFSGVELLLLIPGLNWFLLIGAIVTQPGASAFIAPLVVWNVIGLGYVLIQRNSAEKRRRGSEERARRLEEAARLLAEEEEQRWRHAELVRIGDEAVEILVSLPQHLLLVERNLDQAETEFDDCAFAPFWDAIERALLSMGQYLDGTRQLRERLTRHSQLSTAYGVSTPRFPLSPQTIGKLSISAASSERMRSLVRRAQRNHKFATIYEMRRSNQLLAAGFNTLAQCIDGMSARITESIHDLSASISNEMQSSRGTMDKHHEDVMRAGREHDEREKKALEMLDNIQRRRKPQR